MDPFNIISIVSFLKEVEKTSLQGGGRGIGESTVKRSRQEKQSRDSRGSDPVCWIGVDL